MSDCNIKCPFVSGDNKYDVLINQLNREIAEIKKTATAKSLLYENKLNELCVYIKNNLSNELRLLFDAMKVSGELDEIIIETVMSNLEQVVYKTDGYVSVKQFGAMGNGKCDDTRAIQEAVDSGASAIYFPCGEYVVSKDIVIKNAVHFFGNGNNSVLKCYKSIVTPTDATKMFSIENMKLVNMCDNTLLKIHRTENTGKGFTDFKIHNVTFDSDKGAGTLLSLFGNGQATISNCLFTSTYNKHMDDILTRGIYIYGDEKIGVANINITSCEFNRLHKAIEIEGHESAPDKHCGFRIINNLFVGGHYGVIASYCDSISIENNMIDMIWFPIRLTMSKSPKIRENYIAVNANSENSDAIVLIAPATNQLQRYLDISHNYISSYASKRGNGIVINAIGTLVQYGVISNNIMKLLNIGIVLNGTSESYYVNNLSIHDNMITESEQFISLNDYCLRNRIFNNFVEGNVKSFMNDYTKLYVNDYHGNRFGLKVSEERGTFFGTGDGVTTSFQFAHNLFKKPRWCSGTCQTSVIHGNSMVVTYDDNNIRLWFETAPADGKEIIVNWEISI